MVGLYKLQVEATKSGENVLIETAYLKGGMAGADGVIMRVATLAEHGKVDHINLYVTRHGELVSIAGTDVELWTIRSELWKAVEGIRSKIELTEEQNAKNENRNGERIAIR